MLTQIDIQFLATIQELHLDLQSGCTVITGETGAGKSILMDAIGLALGARATPDMIRVGHEKADISICFDVNALPEALAWLKEYDLDNEDGTCLIRRSISKDGRSRSFINGSPITLQLLRELGDYLIHIHGQHEHQALFKPDTQRDLLDRYAGHIELCAEVAKAARALQNTATNLAELKQSSSERKMRAEFLKFQYQELEALQLRANEFSELDREHKQLSNGGELLENLNLSLGLLSDNEGHNALQSIHQTIHALECLKPVDPKIKDWIESITSANILLSDVEADIRHYLDHVDLDPERLQWVEARISQCFDLARKHKVSPEELHEFTEKMALELNDLEQADDRILLLEKEFELLQKTYLSLAKQLSESRQKAALKIEKEITQMIRELALPHGQFHIHFDKEGLPAFASYGLEKIVFQIATNVGQALQALSKVASGGELSRISLAIHVATAEKHTIPTLIFDEVDVGISGGTAEIVGKLLRRLGESHQLLCITHLAQVASHGQHHLLVQKQHAQNASFTELRYLDMKDKIQEIARLLGGIEITKKTLDYAKEMLGQSKAPSKSEAAETG